MRLFVAVDLPLSIKDQLTLLKTDIPTARWTTSEHMHLTLFFIGETNRVQAVKNALASVQAEAFDVELQGVGCFPADARKPPRVLWAGVTPQPALLDLQNKIAAALREFSTEERAFTPHVTLARLKAEHPLPEVGRFLTANAVFCAPPIFINQFVLYASVLTAQGAHYTQEAIYPLTENRV